MSEDGIEREPTPQVITNTVTSQAKILLTDVDDLMGALRLVASMEYDRAEVRTIAHLALERLKARGIGA